MKIEIKCAYSEIKNLDDLTINPKNPRTLSETGYQNLKLQLSKFGFFKPTIVNPDMMILGGNQRQKALLRIREETGTDNPVPVSIFTGSEEDAEHIVLLDNNTEGEWNKNGLESYLLDLGKLPDFDLTLTGFDVANLGTMNIDLPGITDILVGGKCNEDDIPEVDTEEIITKQGDIWELGNHRLMCGDSTLISDVEKLMAGEKADCLMTDPPYGVNYASKNEFLNNLDKGNRIQKDIENDTIINYREWFFSFLSIIPFADYNTFYIWMSDKELHNLRLAIEDCKYVWGDYLVWVKNNHVLGRKDYNAKHEICVYGWKTHHKFYGDFSTTILNYAKPLKNELHPTMKPVEMFQKLICDGSSATGIILDLFGGSGTTLIACEKAGRKSRLMEINEHYCDVIVERYCKFTGNNNVKLNKQSYKWE